MEIKILLILLLLLHWNKGQQNFTHDQVPIFTVGIFYPTRSGQSAEQAEISLCRAIVDYISRDTPRFRSELVYNTNSKINFQTEDSHIMSSRMQSKLGILEVLNSTRMTIQKAWRPFPDLELQNNDSLHYEGMPTCL